MNIAGVLIGLGALVIIGAVQPVVIKTEYYIGTKAWPVFLLAGLACVAAACFLWGSILSPLLSVLGFSLLWSIRELFEQKKRVAKGWYPRRRSSHHHAAERVLFLHRDWRAGNSD